MTKSCYLSAALLFLLIVTIAGCNEMENFRAQVERSITRLDSESDQWQNIARQIAEDVPAEAKSTIRNEVQSLATKTIAQGGVEFRANVDFLAHRVQQGLKRVLALIDGKQIEAPIPYFAQMDPNTFNINLDPSSRASILLTGWDFDSKDKDGKPVGFALVDAENKVLADIPESRIGRNTHYQITINVSGPEFVTQIWTLKPKKISAQWKGKIGFDGDVSEITVTEWEPKRRKVHAEGSSITYTPPHIGGDGDFSTDDDYPMHIDVRAETQLVDNKSIQIRVGMHAKEHDDDWTEVAGISEWQNAYIAPAGWRIDSLIPGPGVSTDHVDINNHAERDLAKGAAEIARNFHIWGDTDDDEAGTHTRVRVDFQDMDIELEEERPTLETN
jgi:hypothetical protein